VNGETLDTHSASELELECATLPMADSLHYLRTMWLRQSLM
jgi:hypothetical protein